MARKPKYRRHSTRDLAFVEYRGQRHYLPGAYKSHESQEAYREFLRREGFFEPVAAPRVVNIAQLCKLFLTWAQANYPDGNRSENANFRATVGWLLAAVEPQLPVEQFTPGKLKAVQSLLAEEGVSRGYANSTVRRVRRIFRWAVSEELAPPSIYHALLAVPALRRGRSKAKETAPRQPVAWEHVEPVLRELSPDVRAMVLVQWHTGVRSQSLCAARPEQFDCSKQPWEWRPVHKTEHLGHEVTVYVGPQAQAVLRHYLATRRPGEYLFFPKHKCGQRSKGFRSFYDPPAYQRAVKRAIARVNRHRDKDDQIPYWVPHQLRHSRGTLVRERFGLEAAQAVLGHARVDATQLYAKRLKDQARQAAMESG